MKTENKVIDTDNSKNTMQQRIETNNTPLDEMRSEFSVNLFDHGQVADQR